MAQAARKTTTPAQTDTEQKATEHSPEEVNVIELAKDRESMRHQIEKLEKVTAENVVAITSIEDSLSEMTILVRGLVDLQTKPTMTEQVKEVADEAASEVKGRFARTRNMVRRNLKPARPNRDHLKGAMIANAGEYLALVTCAQINPVGTLSVISRALFIA